MGFVEVAYFATALRRMQDTTMVLMPLLECYKIKGDLDDLHRADTKDGAEQELLA